MHYLRAYDCVIEVTESDGGIARRQSLLLLAEDLRNDVEGLLQLLLAICGERTLKRIIRCPNYPLKLETSDLNYRISLFGESLSGDATVCPTVLAELYESAVNEERRKLLGQYFTPLRIAQRAVLKLEPKRDEVIVDAGSGTGMFAIEMLKKCSANLIDPRSLRYIGVESDYLLALCSAVSLEIADAPINWQILYYNFLRVTRKELREIGVFGINGMICNPPFVRYHNISDRNELAAQTLKNTKLDLSRLSGLHSFFLAQSSSLISEGRMIFVLPPEMNGVKYGSTLLNQMREHFSLRITKPDKNSDLLLYSFKTKKVYRKRVSGKDDGSVILGSIASVHRGISTGANKFFLLTDEISKQFSIPTKYLEKIIPPRVRRLPDVFTNADWDSLRLSGKPCWLLVIKGQDFNALPVEIKRYVRYGERLGFHMTATCKGRLSWFSIDIPEQPPKLVFTYMSRGRPRFICNKACSYIVNNLLAVELKNGWLGIKDFEEIAELLNKSLRNWIDHNKVGRTYSGGLLKIEPGDLEKLPISRDLVETIMPPLSNFLSKEKPADPLNNGVVKPKISQTA
jgi:adenine-specific DNA-methyltransferase